MSACPSCGAEIASDARFCPKCGAANPASTASPHPGPEPGVVNAKSDDNVMGALAYLVIPAIIFLIAEPYKSNRFVRFHSFQSLFFWGFSIALQIVLGVLSTALSVIGIGFLIALLMPFVGLALFVLWIVLIVKAFQGEQYHLPYVGTLAAQQV